MWKKHTDVSSVLALVKIVVAFQHKRQRRKSFSRFVDNRPRSIYQYSSMAPRLSGQNCKFFKFPLSRNSQRRLRYKANNLKYRGLTWKPRSHVRILIYRTWPIENTDSDASARATLCKWATPTHQTCLSKLLQTRQTSRNYRKQVLVMIKHCLGNSQINSIPAWSKKFSYITFPYRTLAKVYALARADIKLFIHSAKSKKFSTLKLTLSLTRSIKVHRKALVPYSLPSLWKIRKRI